MFKKILLTSLLLFTFFGSISLGDCPKVTETASKQWWCTKFVNYTGRYCNSPQWFTIREKSNKGKYSRESQQKSFQQYLQDKNLFYSFSQSEHICKIQELINVTPDGKLWNNTIRTFLWTDFCAKLSPESDNPNWNWIRRDWWCRRDEPPKRSERERTERKFDEIDSSQSNSASKCWEHAYTCENGENPSDQKYNEKEKTCTRKCWETQCPEDGKAVKCSTYSEAEQQLWIGLNKDCLVHGGCSLDVYKTLWIRQNSEKETRTSVLSFFQDVIGASTFFIGTILTIAFVISGFRYVLAGASGNDPQNAKNGMKYSIIGFVLVMSAYAIIRFVQYLASTGG